MIHLGDWQAGAVFSDCSSFRYRLWRAWAPGARALFVMLNPSTATHLVLDPTVRKCKLYAERWGYAGVEVCNIFAFRATDPKEMKRQADPIGANNDVTIQAVAQSVDQEGGQVICAWGQHGLHMNRGRQVRDMLLRAEVPMKYLKMGGKGQPWHPLYLKNDQEPTWWEITDHEEVR